MIEQKLDLPIEIEEYIINFLPFEKTLNYPFVCKQKYNPNIHTLNWASYNGHLDVVKWLFVNGNGNDNCAVYAMNLAMKNGHIEVLKWLSVNHKKRCSGIYNIYQGVEYSYIILKQIHDMLVNKSDIIESEYFITKNRILYKYNKVSGIYGKYSINQIIKESKKLVEYFRVNYYCSNVMALDVMALDVCSTEYANIDASQFLLGFPNGVFDLETNEFRKGKPEEYITMKCGIDYNLGNSTELAYKVLHDIFPDTYEFNFALDKLALCLDGFNREQKITFNYGPTGSNGKTFLMKLMCNILGDYGGSFPIDVITRELRVNTIECDDIIPYFKNKRFLYSDLETRLIINGNSIKTLTNDSINVRKRYSNSEEIQTTYKMYVCCNTLPNFNDIDRYINILEFKTNFCEKSNDEKLRLKYSNNELLEIQNGLLLILIERYNKLRLDNFTNI